MTFEELEKSVETLLAKNAELQLQIDRVEAVNDIQRLMGDYFGTHVVNPAEPVNHFNQWGYFADREDSTYEVGNYGLLVGFKNIQFFFREKEEGMSDENGNVYTGWMFEHDLTSPQIVVAADGQTARGVWTSPGHETIAFGGKPQAQWAWGRVAADFIKIDGEWKIWHYHWYRLFRTDFDTPWTHFDQQSVSKPLPIERIKRFGGEPEKVFPCTYFHPYSPETYCECTPRTPQPYDTWSDDLLPAGVREAIETVRKMGEKAVD